jgi:four helix bundle protein
MVNNQYQMSNKKFDIHSRIFEFIVTVINFLNKLPKTPTNIIFINQCTRSVTSVGANDQEADGASTKNDFIHEYIIVRKEGKETLFWIQLIARTNGTKYAEEARTILKEGNEIIAIISTIIKNTQMNGKR